MLLAHTARVTDTVEELEDLHGALAPEADAVTEAGGADAAMLAGVSPDDCGELGDARSRVEEIAHHLIGAAERHLLAQYRANALLTLVQRRGELAHPGRVEASGEEQRLESQHELRIAGRKRDHMFGQMQPDAAA
ncbi:MAG TPA: hypothetical protein VEH00_11160 [Steroidobacteraceae bacterium]|nr:hypothetical protein [Steroidobacteraceae bacterium]